MGQFLWIPPFILYGDPKDGFVAIHNSIGWLRKMVTFEQFAYFFL